MFSVCHGYTWTDRLGDNSTLEACMDSSASFSWDLNVDSATEDIIGARWLFHGADGTGEEVIAMYR